MILHLSQDQQFVVFKHEDPREKKALETTPGFLREGLIFYTPARGHIVNNLIFRLRRKGVDKIGAGSGISDLLQKAKELKQLPKSFAFYTKPLEHQHIALRFGYTYERFGLLLEPGLGKTKVILDYVHLLLQEGLISKACIVCPKPLLFIWKEESEKHRPELKVHIIETSSWDKEKALCEGSDVIVVNYDKFVTLSDAFRALRFGFLGVDEGLIKNHTTNRSKAILRLSREVPYKSIMSGTLVNNSPLDVFSPIQFLEPSLVGTSFTRFKDEYSLASKANRNIVIGFKHVPEVKDILRSCSIVMRKEEWLKNLPTKTFHEIYVQMGDLQRGHYQDLASNYIVQIQTEEGDKFVEVDNPLQVLIKLTQISQGFLYYKDALEADELKELFCEGKDTKVVRKTFFYEGQPKMEALLKLVEAEGFNRGVGLKRRSLIWYTTIAERAIIESGLARAGHTFLTIAGGMKNVGGIVKEFNTNPSFRFLVCQAKSINYGVTIMGSGPEEDTEVVPDFDPSVADEIFYSVGFSLEVFLQQQDRIHRIGQLQPCHYWLIMTNSPIERKVNSMLQKKLECNRAILVDIAESLDLGDL